MRRLGLILPLLLVAAPVLADTIILKNGRRIVATNVVEENGHVSYDTPAGHLSLPKSIVARIERGSVLDSSPASPGGATAGLRVAPPRIERLDAAADSAEIARRAVHDGVIDQAYLAWLENQAREGGADAVGRVAAAHNAAAEFLLEKGEVDQAIEHCRRALSFAPQNLTSLLNVSYLYLQRSEYTTALDFLERARRLAPNSPDVAKLTGWAYYGTNRLDEAVAEWKRALRLRDDPDVERALEKAERDQKAERSYREGETAHFTLRYSGTAAPNLARAILRVLEQEFNEIQSELDYTPPEPIAVILYTQEAFTDVTRAPGWVGALNDGRLRVPVEGLSSVTPELARILKHELTHSFVHQKTLGRCPRWLQEGIAQWTEGRRSREDAEYLVATYDAFQRAGAPPLLGRMEGPWEQYAEDAVRFAYAWSLAAVENIVAGGGESDLVRLLDRVATSDSTEAALRDAIRMDYADLERATAYYLRRTYGR